MAARWLREQSVTNGAAGVDVVRIRMGGRETGDGDRILIMGAEAQLVIQVRHERRR
jgi:hypothetical protein